MKNLKKKGFTIVELVIVIAVIAVLAAVLIPTFVDLTRKANVSADTVLVKNLNTSLSSDAKEHKAMHDALEAAKANGYDIAKIQTKANGNKILWDSKNDCFVYLDSDKDKIVYIPDTKSVDVENKDLWVISNEVSDTYSTYLYGYDGTEVTAKLGLDTGDSSIEKVVLNTDAAGELTIRTNGGVLELNAANATVNHYGLASEVYVKDVASSTYNLFGIAAYIEVSSGEHVVLKAGSTVNAIFVDGTKNVEIENGQEDVVLSTEDGVSKDDVLAAATKFAGGLGTKENPYLIANVEHLLNINEEYEKGYSYYKVADGVKTLDLTSYGTVQLNGSFDGNNVKIVNLTTSLFRVVGYQNENANIKIANMDVTMNVTNGYALVRNIYNSGKTIFENVQIHGYIEGLYNMGSFYNYGTANYDGKGCDYTVEFINSTSNATLVCTSGNGIGGMIGHGYEGAGNTISIIIDSKSQYIGRMYTTNGSVGDKLMYMCSNSSNFNLNGNVTSGYDASFNYTTSKLNVVEPEKNDSGYIVDCEAGATKLIVMINAQATAYDASGNKIANLSGMTWPLGSIEITDLTGDNQKVFDLIENAVIVNGTDHDLGYSYSNGTLTIYSGKSENYAEAVVKIQVNQVGPNGDLVATGTTNIFEIKK